MGTREGKVPPRRATVLGIDAGGTGTVATLVETGIVTERFTSPPLNHRLHDGALELLCELIERARPSRVGIGLPGVRSANEAHSMATELQARTGVPAAVSHDAEIAQLGAFGGAPGIVVIAGTGSIAWGCDGRGGSARAGAATSWGMTAAGTGWEFRPCSPRVTAPALRRGWESPSASTVRRISMGSWPASMPIPLTDESCLDSCQCSRGRPRSTRSPHLYCPTRLSTSCSCPGCLATPARGAAGRIGRRGLRVDAIRERVVAATSAVPAGKPPQLGAVWLAERRSDDGS